MIDDDSSSAATAAMAMRDRSAQPVVCAVGELEERLLDLGAAALAQCHLDDQCVGVRSMPRKCRSMNSARLVLGDDVEAVALGGLQHHDDRLIDDIGDAAL